MIRTIYIFLWVGLSTIFWGSTAVIISFFTRTGNPVHKVARIWARGILFVSRIKVTVNGLANIDPTQSYVYMSNHQSNFDIPVLLAYLPVQFRWLAKAELFKIPIFGRAMRGAGYVKIDRFNQEAAFESLNEAAGKMKNGVSVMIFPEGTRSRDGTIGRLNKGAFKIARLCQTPIKVLYIRNTNKLFTPGKFLFNTLVSNTITVEPITGIEPDYQSDKFSISELMSQVRSLLETKKEKTSEDL